MKRILAMAVAVMMTVTMMCSPSIATAAEYAENGVVTETTDTTTDETVTEEGTTDTNGTVTDETTGDTEVTYEFWVVLNSEYGDVYPVGKPVEFDAILKYSDGNTIILSESEYRCETYDYNTAGEKSFNVYYLQDETKYATVNVVYYDDTTVTPGAGVSGGGGGGGTSSGGPVSSGGNTAWGQTFKVDYKQNYQPGEELSYNVYVENENGEKVEVTDYGVGTNFESEVSGLYDVTIKYGDETVTFPVIVVENVSDDEATALLFCVNNDAECYVGEMPDIGAEAKLSNGSTIPVYLQTADNPDGYTLSGYDDTYSAGTYTAYVSYSRMPEMEGIPVTITVMERNETDVRHKLQIEIPNIEVLYADYITHGARLETVAEIVDIFNRYKEGEVYDGYGKFVGWFEDHTNVQVYPYTIVDYDMVIMPRFETTVAETYKVQMFSPTGSVWYADGLPAGTRLGDVEGFMSWYYYFTLNKEYTEYGGTFLGWYDEYSKSYVNLDTTVQAAMRIVPRFETTVTETGLRVVLNKNTYNYGEDLDITVYLNGTVIEPAQITSDGNVTNGYKTEYDAYSSGEQTFNVTYGEYYTEVTVNVLPKDSNQYWVEIYGADGERGWAGYYEAGTLINSDYNAASLLYMYTDGKTYDYGIFLGWYDETTNVYVSAETAVHAAMVIKPRFETSPVEDMGILGDVNYDGKIAMADAMRILQFLVKKCDLDGSAYGSSAVGSDYFYRADVTDDGAVTIKDAQRIAQYLAKLCNLDGTPLNN